MVELPPFVRHLHLCVGKAGESSSPGGLMLQGVFETGDPASEVELPELADVVCGVPTSGKAGGSSTLGRYLETKQLYPERQRSVSATIPRPAPASWITYCQVQGGRWPCQF